jgi:hypothetical protein
MTLGLAPRTRWYDWVLIEAADSGGDRRRRPALPAAATARAPNYRQRYYRAAQVL